MTRNPLLSHLSRPAPERLAIALAAALGLASMGALAAGADPVPFDYRNAGATLTYSIQISGQARDSKAGGDLWSKAEVSRSVEGTLHLAGRQEHMTAVDNPREMIARTARARQAMAADVPTLERIAEECGDDEACMNTRMMAFFGGMSSDKRAALASATAGPAAKFSRHAIGVWGVDGKTACSIRARSRGASSYRALAQGEGYAEHVTGSEQRHGHASSDCRRNPYPDGRARWDGDRKLLELTLPGLALTEQWKSADGKHGARRIVIPDVELEHLHWSGKGPQSGRQVRHVSVPAGKDSVPATMIIHWTFSPDRA